MKSNDPWGKEVEINKADGSVLIKYTYNGSPCYVADMMECGMASTLAGYHLIRHNMIAVKKWLDLARKHGGIVSDSSYRLTEENDSEYIKPLFVACFVFYTKAFTTTEGRKVKLEKENIDSNLHRLHDLIVKMRHSYAAHAGIGTESARTILAFSKEGEGVAYRVDVPLMQPSAVYFPEESVVSFESLVDSCISFCNKKIDTLNQPVPGLSAVQRYRAHTGTPRRAESTAL